MIGLSVEHKRKYLTKLTDILMNDREIYNLDDQT